MIVYIMPPLMALKIIGHRLSLAKKALFCAVILTGIVMGISATVVTILEFIEDLQHE